MTVEGATISSTPAATKYCYNGSNKLPSSVSTRAGDNSLIATQLMTYDNVGNLASVDGPLSGTAE